MKQLLRSFRPKRALKSIDACFPLAEQKTLIAQLESKGSFVSPFAFKPVTDERYRCLVNGEEYFLPGRIYYSDQSIDLSSKTERILFSCLLTRHYSGYIREKYLKLLLRESDLPDWVLPYLFVSLADYVPEVKQIVPELANADTLKRLTAILKYNEPLFSMVTQRVVSYSNSYRGSYKNHPTYSFLQEIVPKQFV